MLTPSIFGENLFDDWFDDFPFFDDRDLRKVDKKLYGRRAGNLMKTDIQEMKDGYKMEVDLPGFKKDEITVELDDGSVPPRDWIRTRRRKNPDVTSAESVMQVPAAGASMWARA